MAVTAHLAIGSNVLDKAFLEDLFLQLVSDVDRIHDGYGIFGKYNERKASW